MIRSRVSIARLLVIVLIAGLDCALIRFFLSTGIGSEGIMTFGLAMSAGAVGWLVGRGRLRRFSIGFMIAGVLGAVAFLAMIVPDTRAGDWYLNTFVFSEMQRLPATLRVPESRVVGTSPGEVELVPGVALLLCVDVLICLPVLVVALFGGLLTLGFRRRERFTPAPGPIPT